MGDDQMVLGLDRDLHIVTDHPGAAPAGGHRARVRIGEGDLLVGGGQHLRLDHGETVHLLAELGDLLLQPRRLGCEHLRGLLSVGGIELLQIARNALLDLRPAPLDLGAREVPVTVVDCLELAAVDRDAGAR